MTTLCTRPGCRVRSRHTTDCPDTNRCGGCQPAHTDPGQLLCPTHITRAATDLDAVGTLYPHLLDALTHPPAGILAAGPIPGRSNHTRVSGTPAPAVPIDIDLLDLTADARPRTEPETGLLSVATVLDSWATDWRQQRSLRETRPGRTVAALTDWLTNRLPWATTSSARIGEFAVDIDQLHHQITRMLGLTELVHRLPAACPTCDRKALTRRNGHDRVECGHCQRIWTETEYQRLVGVLASTRVA